MKKMFNTAFLLLMTVMALQAQPANFTWKKTDNTQPYIHGIKFDESNPAKIMVLGGEVLFDITTVPVEFFISGGGGYKVSTDSGKTFDQSQLSGYYTFDLHQSILNENIWFAAVRDFTGGIFKSTDGGNSWDTDNLLCESTGQIYRINCVEREGREILFTSSINTFGGIKYSDDEFSSCTTVDFTVNSSDLKIRRGENEAIYAAGNHQSEGKVYRSYDGGQSWLKDSSGLKDLRVLCVQPSLKDPSIVFAGVDSVTFEKSSIGKGIYISNDSGKTWRPHSAFGAQVFDIKVHPYDHNFMAAACGELGIWLSSENGEWWETYNEGLPEGGSARMVGIPYWEVTDDGFRMFAAIQGEGLYESGYMTTDVEAFETAGIPELSIFPQPVTDELGIIWNNNEAGRYSVKLIDQLGREKRIVNNTWFPTGPQSIKWRLDGTIRPGIHFIIIEGKEYSTAEKIMVAGQ
ncbi:MAG: hypothetical protein ACOC2K_04360 [Bacteroidota bacterium]